MSRLTTEIFYTDMAAECIVYSIFISIIISAKLTLGSLKVVNSRKLK